MYPLENLEVVNLCSRLQNIRRGQPKYPNEYYDLRNEYHASKDKNGVRYSYRYNNGSEDGKTVSNIETVGRQDIGYVIKNNTDHSLYAIHFGPRFPSTEEVTLNNTLAMKGIRPFIYEIGTVETDSFYELSPVERRDNTVKRSYQEKNEDGKLMWYWITDYFKIDYLLDTICKNASNIESVYNMFAIMLPLLHSKNYVIPKFEMKQMFSGYCSNYKDNTIRSLMCVCPFKRWFYYPDEKYVRGNYVIPNPEQRHVASYIHNEIVRIDYSRYSSVRTDESSIVEPLDNWMSVMFIMLDAMGMFIPDCIIYDNDYKRSRFRIYTDTDTDTDTDTITYIYNGLSYADAVRKFNETYDKAEGTQNMYRYLLNKYLWMHEMPSVTYDGGRSYEANLKNKRRMVKNWKKEFVKYINWMLLNYTDDMSSEYIKTHLDGIVRDLANGQPFNVDGVQWSYYNLFVTCIGYLSMIKQFKRNYIDTTFMLQNIPSFIHTITLLYTAWLTFNDEEYMMNLRSLNPTVDIPTFTDAKPFADFLINNNLQYQPVIFSIDTVEERASYDRFVEYTCINNYTYPIVQNSPQLTVIMDNVMGINISEYIFENVNNNDYLTRMNTLASQIVGAPSFDDDPRFYNIPYDVRNDRIQRNMRRYINTF